ncbi:MAG: hypothetical protein AAFX95_25065 [Cyanobacteria bacterium J06639_16]
MPKKRLSDLLREEVDKPTEQSITPSLADQPAAADQRNPVNPVDSSEATASTNAMPDANTSKRTPARRRSASRSTSQAKTTTSRSSRAPTKADLEKQVADLKKQLAAVEEQENPLQKQVTGLKADLEKQQALIFQLKENLESAQTEAKSKAQAFTKLSEELETAKQTIRQLNQQAKTPSTLAKAPAESKPTKQPLSITRPADNRHPNASRIAPLPAYVIQSGPKPTMLTDEEIGWVD